jgi:hypothetical protein
MLHKCVGVSNCLHAWACWVLACRTQPYCLKQNLLLKTLWQLFRTKTVWESKPHNVSNKQHRNKPVRGHGVSYDIPDEKW